MRCSIIALEKVLNHDEPLIRDELKALDGTQCKAAINQEVNTLEKMDFSKLVNPPKHQKSLHTKYASRRKRNDNGEITKYEARFAVYGNGELTKDELISCVADYSIVKLILCLALKQKRHIRNCEFQNDFRNGVLKRPV